MIEKHSSESLRSQPKILRVIVFAIALAVSAVAAPPFMRHARAESAKDYAERMTQAKLQADLGNHRQAAEGFAFISGDPNAPEALRSEAMVRLGLALNAAGDFRASLRVFKEGVARTSKDPTAFRFLTYAVARTVPGKVWPDFRTQFEELLKTADPISSQELAMGDPVPKRVHLQQRQFELDAAWKPLPPSNDRTRGSSRGEIAAYELDKILGLNMVPPTVERIIEGRRGSMQLWISGCQLYAQFQGRTPTTSDWSHQVSRMHLFDALIGNRDRNVANVLVDSNLEIVLLDHSLSFSNETELQNPPTHFDRRLLDKLRALREDELQVRFKGILGGEDIRSMLKRRDALLAHLARLVADKGETAVLF